MTEDIGATMPTVSFQYDRADLVRYAAASGDFNPIHYDREAAHAAGLEDIVVHGMFNMAVLGTYLEQWMGARYRIIDWRTRFRGFVSPGQLVHLSGSVKLKTEAEIVILLAVTVGEETRPAVTAEARLQPV